MNNLKTFKGRTAAIKVIEDSFIKSLIENGFEISEDAVCYVYEYSIIIWAFGSEITLYPKRHGFTNTINYGTSGSFDPSDLASYWRTIHAATILKNWDKACEIINSHCKAYSDLEKEIIKENK